MHPRLVKHLNSLGIAPDTAPDRARWGELLQLISSEYELSDAASARTGAVADAAEMQATTTAQRLQALIKALPDLVFLLDEDGRYIEIMAGDQDRLFMPPEDLKGKLMSEIFPPETASQFMGLIRRALDTRTLQTTEYPLEVPAGRTHFEGRAMPCELTANGRRTAVFLARDITELAQAREELRHAALHDPLTGLMNRASLDERLLQATSRARRHGSLCAVLMVDLDWFKDINDELGHQVGDQVLCELAHRLQQSIRIEDSAFRYGGDEFVALLEDLHNAGEATRIAEQVRAAIGAPLKLADREFAVTSSIGITITSGADSPTELLRQTDHALYAAKDAGRNRYLVHTEQNSGTTPGPS